MIPEPALLNMTVIDVEIIRCRGVQFLQAHHESAVAVQRDDGAVGTGEFRADRSWQPDAHAGPRPGGAIGSGAVVSNSCAAQSRFRPRPHESRPPRFILRRLKSLGENLGRYYVENYEYPKQFYALWIYGEDVGV